MRKTVRQKPKPADTLLKTSKKKDIELTERELDNNSTKSAVGNPAPLGYILRKQR
jgi:hypothetical protein